MLVAHHVCPFSLESGPTPLPPRAAANAHTAFLLSNWLPLLARTTPVDTVGNTARAAQPLNPSHLANPLGPQGEWQSVGTPSPMATSARPPP